MSRTRAPALSDANKAPLTNYLRRKRLAMVSDFLRGDVLEIGCGNASLFDAFGGQSHIKSYTGMEHAPSTVEELRSRYPEARFIQGDLEALTWQLGEAQYDTIVGLAVIEHIWNQRSFFENLISLLRPGGRIVLTTPTPLGNDLVLTLAAKVGLVREDMISDHIVIYNKKRFIHVATEFEIDLIYYKKFQFCLNQVAVYSK